MHERKRSLFFPLLAVLFAVACAGVKARENISMPTMSAAWSKVIAPHVEIGVAANEAKAKQQATTMAEGDRAGVLTAASNVALTIRKSSASMQEALDSGDRFKVAVVDWATLKAAAIAGISARVQAGTIGPGVGMSFMETITQFDANHTQLLQR